MPSIYVIPDKISFSIPYSDNSGERIKVDYALKSKEIAITTTDVVWINRGDIPWLIEVLQDINRIDNEVIQKEPKPQ